jgi:hypothetical protein
LTFYDCNNTKGFSVNGSMDSNEENFKNEYCPWQMVTGPSGTFLKTIHFLSELLGESLGYENNDPANFLKSWYYDNAIPNNFSSGNPKHPNGWIMCSASVNNQVCYGKQNLRRARAPADSIGKSVLVTDKIVP